MYFQDFIAKKKYATIISDDDNYHIVIYSSLSFLNCSLWQFFLILLQLFYEMLCRESNLLISSEGFNSSFQFNTNAMSLYLDIEYELSRDAGVEERRGAGALPIFCFGKREGGG